MRQSIKVNKPVAITEDGSLLTVQDIFNYTDGMHGEPFAGATGLEHYGITQAEIDERNDPDYVRETYELDYHWREAVASGSTELSLEEYVQDAIDNADGYFFGHDDGGAYDIPSVIQKTHFDGCETFECVSAGRIFGEEKRSPMIILDQDLWDAVQAIEADPTLPLEMLADLLGLEVEEK